jgi:hypothetical protein
MGIDIKQESIFEKGALKGNFGAKVDKANKKVYLYFEGYFETSCAEKFFKEYTEAKASVNLKETSLVILAKNLKPFPQEALSSAGEIYKDYTNFKDITFVEPENVIAKMQIHRVLKENKIEDKYNFVKDI